MLETGKRFTLSGPKRKAVLGTNGHVLSWLKLRGGANANHFHDETSSNLRGETLQNGELFTITVASDKDESAAAVEATTETAIETASESSNVALEISNMVRVDEEVDKRNKEETTYATIGILNLLYSDCGISPNQDHRILLCFKRKDILSCQIESDSNLPSNTIWDEWWGIQKVVEKDEHAPKVNGHDVNDLAVAEIMGCLCNAIVLNLPHQILTGNRLFHSEYCAQHLDDMLFCVAEGIVRRLKSMKHRAESGVTTSLLVTFGRKYVTEHEDSDLDKSNLKEYIQEYLDHALHRALKHHFGNRLCIEHTVSEDSMPLKWRIIVSSSPYSATETAAQMAEKCLMFQVDSSMQDSGSDSKIMAVWEDIKKENSKKNCVPQSLFGVLAATMCTDICNRWLSQNNYRNKISISWEKISENCHAMNVYGVAQKEGESNNIENVVKSGLTTEKISSVPTQLLSTDFQHKFQTLTARVFIDAEESLSEMENKMDGAFLDENDVRIEKIPMPEFGSDADALLSAISASFSTLMDEAGITDLDRKWAECE